MVHGRRLSLTLMRAAIIGLGQIAWRYDGGLPAGGVALTHLSALRQAGLDIIGTADPNAQVRHEFATVTGINTHAKIATLLDMAPDVVSIASPNEFHEDHLVACLKAGVKYIWLEKPATTDPAATGDLASRAMELGVRVMVGFQRRYMPSYLALGQDDLGDLIGIDVTYSRGLETNGAHMVDLILWLFKDQMPDLLGVVPGPLPPVHNHEPCPSFLLLGAGKVPVTVTGLDLKYHSIDIVAHYSEGRRAVRHGGQTLLAEVKTPNPLFPGSYYLTSEHGPQNLENEVGSAFPAMVHDLLYGGGDQPLSNLRSAGLGQSIVAQVLDKCV